jgi:hypothetical protein
MGLKIAQQIRLHIPPFTFADQAHGYQLAVAALRLGAGSFEKWRQLQADIVNNAEYIQAKIAEILYHWSALLFDWLGFVHPQSYRRTSFWVGLYLA